MLVAGPVLAVLLRDARAAQRAALARFRPLALPDNFWSLGNRARSGPPTPFATLPSHPQLELCSNSQHLAYVFYLFYLEHHAHCKVCGGAADYRQKKINDAD
jgi:hypothetical protein